MPTRARAYVARKQCERDAIEAAAKTNRRHFVYQTQSGTVSYDPATDDGSWKSVNVLTVCLPDGRFHRVGRIQGVAA